MVTVTSSVEASRARRAVNIKGVDYWLTTFIGATYLDRNADKAAKEPQIGNVEEQITPVAFLVEQPPEAVTPAHFHITSQFQLVVHGGGRLGSHPLEETSVHFTNAHTPYGPIVSDYRGVTYFTLRTGYDAGAQHMPERAAGLRGISRKPREVIGHAAKLLTETDLGALDQTAAVELISGQTDGLQAWLYRSPPNQKLQGIAPATGGGQFWVVQSGSMAVGESVALPKLSCAFVMPDDDPMSYVAGSNGAQVVCMQFPKRARS